VKFVHGESPSETRSSQSSAWINAVAVNPFPHRGDCRLASGRGPRGGEVIGPQLRYPTFAVRIDIDADRIGQNCLIALKHTRGERDRETATSFLTFERCNPPADANLGSWLLDMSRKSAPSHFPNWIGHTDHDQFIAGRLHPNVVAVIVERLRQDAPSVLCHRSASQER
jgi:hypothetical protein